MFIQEQFIKLREATKRRKPLGLVVLVLAIACCAAHASADSPRKRTALALQGGGALGLIHLGAIEWLEEHRIPIDGIAGNSGGALSGGWYATGLDLLTDAELRDLPVHDGPDSMRLHGVAEILGALDYAALFASSPSYGELPLARKLERRRYPSEIVNGIANGAIRSPDGLLAGPKVRLLLDAVTVRYPIQVLYGAGAEAPFDSLPTPFRCVSTDATDKNLANWSTEVLGGKNMLPKAAGYRMSLSRALRASMAIPVAFTPVYVPPLPEPGGPTQYALVDGFVKDNYPIDVADTEFRPDVLIGFYFGDYTAKYVPKADYVPVQLDTGGLTADQYPQWRRLTWLGYQSMERAYRSGALDRLKPLMLPLEEYLEFRRRRRNRASTISTTPQDVVAPDGVPTERLRAAVVGKDVTDNQVRAELDGALLELLSDGNLATIGYELHEQDGKTVLHVQPEVRAYGPPFIHAGTAFEIGSRDRLWVELAGVAVAPTHQGSLWKVEAAAGTDQRASVAFESPTKRNGLVLSPSASFDNGTRFKFVDGRRASEVSLLRADAGLSVKYRPRKDAEFTFGAFAAAIDAAKGLGVPLDVPSGGYGYVTLGGEIDTTDAAVDPTTGVRGRLDVRNFLGLPGSSDLSQLEVHGSWYRPVGRKGGRLFLRAAAATSFGRRAPFSAQFGLGGLGAMDAFVRDEIRGSGYAYGSVGGLSRVSSLPFYLGTSYLGWWLETTQIGDRNWSSGTLGLLVRTRLTTTFTGVSMDDAGRLRLQFVTGPFRL